MPERDCALTWTAVDGNDGWRGLHFFLLSQVNLEYFSLGKFFRDGISIHYSFLSVLIALWRMASARASARAPFITGQLIIIHICVSYV